MDSDGGDLLEWMVSGRGYRGWWNEQWASLMDLWGNSGNALELWMQKYKE
jgi:hypothetical protein